MKDDKRGESGIARIVLILALFLILIAVTSSIFSILGPKPPIGLALSLDPTTIRENETSRLTISVKNLDLETHTIKFVFDANLHISIYAGNEQLLPDNTYSFTMEASDPSEERVFTVQGSLEEKTSSSDYPIKLKVYVDGNELAKSWNDLILTIRE